MTFILFDRFTKFFSSLFTALGLMTRRYDIVVVITRSDVLGGAQKYLLSLLPFMQSSKNILVVTGYSSYNSLFIKKLNDIGVSVFVSRFACRNLNLFLDFFFFIELYLLFLLSRCKCVWLHSSKAGLVGRIAGALAMKSVLFTVHGWSFSSCSTSFFKFHFYLFIERLSAFLTTKFIVICRHDFQIAIDNLRISRRKLVLIYNSVVPPILTQSFQHSRFNILYLSRIDRQKKFASFN